MQSKKPTYEELEVKIRELEKHLRSIRQTEQALKESESDWRFLVSHAPGIIFNTDLNGNILFVNKTIPGLKIEDVVGKGIHDFINPRDIDRVKTFVDRVIETGEASGYETCGREGLDSSWYAVRIGPVKKGKKVGGLVFILTDITERKQAEQALRQSEERYRRMVEAVTAYTYSVTLTDGKAVATSHSPGCLAVTGYSPKDYASDPYLWYAMIFHEDRERVSRHLERILAGMDVPPLEHRIVHRHGSIRWVRDTVVLFRDSTGRLFRYDGLVEDITGRKTVEEALRKSEEKYRELVENIDAVVYSTDLNGLFTYVSPVVESLLGYKPEEMIGRHLTDKAHPEECTRIKDRFRQILSGDIRPDEYRVLTKSGETRWIRSSSKPFSPENEVAGLHGVLTDITGRKQLEEERNRAAKLESVGLLAGGIAHDFNNILTAILGNISLAKMAATEDVIVERLTEAEKASERARELTHQLLTFAKGGAPVKKVTPLAALLIESAGFAVRGSSVSCEFSLEDDLWPVEIDEGQIGQVIDNVVINAIQAMPQGGIIRIRAENVLLDASNATELMAGKYVRVSITDQGTGIPEEILPKIFDPYFSTKSTGSGLGLATAYSIVRRHGGHLSVESKLNTGTTFQFHLPASSGEVRSRLEVRGIKTLIGRRILVMDDQEPVRTVLSHMLEHLGHQTEAASDGREAVEIYRKAKESGRAFDAVIVDLTVPGGMGGREVLRKLLELDPAAKVIVSSGYSNDPVLSQYRKFGFSGIISKPYKIEDLSKTIYSVLAEFDKPPENDQKK